MGKPIRVIGPFPPIWRMQELKIHLETEMSDKVKIKIYERIITKLSEFHCNIDNLRDGLAEDIEDIIANYNPSE